MAKIDKTDRETIAAYKALLDVREDTSLGARAA